MKKYLKVICLAKNPIFRVITMNPNDIFDFSEYSFDNIQEAMEFYNSI